MSAPHQRVWPIFYNVFESHLVLVATFGIHWKFYLAKKFCIFYFKTLEAFFCVVGHRPRHMSKKWQIMGGWESDVINLSKGILCFPNAKCSALGCFRLSTLHLCWFSFGSIEIRRKMVQWSHSNIRLKESKMFEEICNEHGIELISYLGFPG